MNKFEAKQAPQNKGLSRAGEGRQRSRRSGRLPLQVEILLLGSDERGRVFSEDTHTVMVSLHGAGILSCHKLMPEQLLILRQKSSNSEAEVCVVGMISQQGEFYTYGVKFVEEEPDFWKVEFPEAPQQGLHPVLTVMECSECKSVVELETWDFERDIYAIDGELARFCTHCGLLTMWRLRQELLGTPSRGATMRHGEGASKIGLAVETAAGETSGLTVLADSIERIERRRKMRAKVNFCAYVKSQKDAGDVVRCIDMSRDGVSFRSRNPYVRETRVQIAVPFSLEASMEEAIFVCARIANVTKNANEEGMWRFGVEFVKE
jgi:hypothetical protein